MFVFRDYNNLCIRQRHAVARSKHTSSKRAAIRALCCREGSAWKRPAQRTNAVERRCKGRVGDDDRSEQGPKRDVSLAGGITDMEAPIVVQFRRLPFVLHGDPIGERNVSVLPRAL